MGDIREYFNAIIKAFEDDDRVEAQWLYHQLGPKQRADFNEYCKALHKHYIRFKLYKK